MASFAIIAPLRVSAGFRLDDGLGRDRKARANRRRAVFGDDVTHRVNPPRDDFSLLDGPSRRVGRGRASVSPSHEASRARTSHLREAKRPTLGLLDELGERAARRARRLAAGPNGANTDTNADVAYSVSSFASASRPTRGGAEASGSNARARPGRDPTPPRHQRRVLGLLTGPSARVGRAARRGAAAGGVGTRDREVSERGPYRADANAAEPLLGILSGPGKRVGRKSK